MAGNPLPSPPHKHSHTRTDENVTAPHGGTMSWHKLANMSQHTHPSPECVMARRKFFKELINLKMLVSKKSGNAITFSMHVVLCPACPP